MVKKCFWCEVDLSFNNKETRILIKKGDQWNPESFINYICEECSKKVTVMDVIEKTEKEGMVLGIL